MMGRSRRIGFEHLPHFGRSAARETSILFHVKQNWQRSVALVVVPVFSVVAVIVFFPRSLALDS
jgi:hypothetical protein